MIHFAHPELLILLLLLPPLAFLRGRKGRATSVRFSSTEVLREISGVKHASSGAARMSLRLLTMACIVVAMARPQIVSGYTQVEASGIDVMLGLDISSSMEALDFTLDGREANRLQVVKSVVEKFIQERPNDRIGVVAFAGRPYLASPLTLDHDWLLDRLEKTKIGSVEDGTALGSALAAASARLDKQPAKSKIVILLTDGMNNAGKISPEVAAHAAKALGIKVYTVGAGTRGEAPVPVADSWGRKRVVMAKVDIDEETLREIAQVTGGAYYRATDTGSLSRIYDEINRLERTTHIVRKFENVTEVFPWAAWSAIVLIALELFVVHGWYRRVP